MPKIETNRRKIVSRLVKEGWKNRGGGEHDVYEHHATKRSIAVPRHRTISTGVARKIARVAGWL